jgi:mannose/fructose-specific phosphotransferase system component IIA
MSLVATMASQYEESGAGIAQDWINRVAVCCQEAILAADISGGSPERMKREAMEHVNHILGGVRFPIERGDHH